MKKYNVCIVGGGSTYTLGFLKSFARMQEEFPLNKLVLFDIDGERQKPIGQYGEIMFKERYPELDFSYTTDPAEAYKDMEGIEILDEIRRETNDSNDIIISTWTPKRILK